MKAQDSAMSESDARSALGSELAAETIRAFGGVRLRVFGTSMAPAILPGDTISIEKASLTEMCAGEIAIFSREGRLFAHRVIGRTERDGEARLLTRGDRLGYSDAPVSPAELLGRVRWIHRGGVRLAPQATLSLRQKAILRVLRVSNLATRAYVRLARFERAANGECGA